MEPLLKVSNVSIAYKQGDFRDIGLKEWVIRRCRSMSSSGS